MIMVLVLGMFLAGYLSAIILTGCLGAIERVRFNKALKVFDDYENGRLIYKDGESNE